METSVTEIAPDVFRISTYVGPPSNLAFNQFLVRDDAPLLYHTGMRALFPAVREAVARLIDPATIRWIGFSHFEVDECGALNEWLATAPRAEALCSLTGVLVNMSDYAARPARGLISGEVIETGRHRFRFLQTPHLPHGWDAGHLFDETTKTLLVSDLLHQNGDVEAVLADLGVVLERCAASLRGMQASPLTYYMPYTPRTEQMLAELAGLEPETVATMHGSAYAGDGRQALLEFGRIMKELYAG
jgi:flavorubredoxin